MPQKLKRRTFLKRIFGTFLTVLGLGSGGYFYAKRIEPSLLEINKLEIKHSLIPNSFNGIKIVQFSDTHLGFHYNLNQLKNLVKKINHLQPDIIIFTGDLLDEPNKYKEINKVAPILQQLKANMGKYCIYGNHDHGGYGSEIYKNLMELSNFTVLLNESLRIKQNDGSFISLLGIDDQMLGKPDLSLAMKQVTEDSFKLLLSHAPDIADEASAYQIHWQLSGHSHGGQVKIPFIGALVIPPFAKNYPEGFYSIGTSNPLSLYVNRGIGTTRLPFRFMAKPEITVFTLVSAKTD
ncbi:metallophosphoesterase [Neobacillus vireti]|uniref:metallophosphoesterase n=1 Tax=Neobacillus vireti TaxID=220686 RepID=UPI002FFF2DC3